ncbi:MAG: hypothetical protein M1819_006016 [Sarea resinae]|nr:MAG: hypothetical protein M1819_006016 [Sarea resinae]
MSRLRRWEIEQARVARELPIELEQDEMEIGTDSFHQPQDVENIDILLQQQDAEIAAQCSSMENDTNNSEHDDNTSTNYGSDEEDYDHLFLEVLGERSEGHSGYDDLCSTSGALGQGDDHKMDTSNG